MSNVASLKLCYESRELISHLGPCTGLTGPALIGNSLSATAAFLEPINEF